MPDIIEWFLGVTSSVHNRMPDLTSYIIHTVMITLNNTGWLNHTVTAHFLQAWISNVLVMFAVVNSSRNVIMFEHNLVSFLLFYRNH